MPSWIWIPIAAVPLAAFAIPKAYTTLGDAMTGKSVTKAIDQTKPASFPLANTATVSVASNTTLPSSIVTTTNIQTAIDLQPPRVQYSGCIEMKKRCQCFTQDGFSVKLDALQCTEALYNLGQAVPIFPTQSSFVQQSVIK